MDTMNIIEEKKILRKSMLNARLAMDEVVKKVFDNSICEQLMNIINEREVKIVHAYLPMGNEIDITPLITKLLECGVKVVTPKTLKNRVLENRILHSLSRIEKGVFGTTHPLEKDVYDGPFDLVIVPGLAFDGNNYRLGYGGGYYDNFLVHHKLAYKVGIFYSFQKVINVPIEGHDLVLNQIIEPIK